MHGNLHVKFPLVIMAVARINLQFSLTLIAVICVSTWIFNDIIPVALQSQEASQPGEDKH